jgi:hypothetical protein
MLQPDTGIVQLLATGECGDDLRLRENIASNFS